MRFFRHGCFLLALLLGPLSAEATLRVLTVAGASAISDDLLTIYGGLAGTCSTTSTTATCDSCTGSGTNFEICNKQRVHSDLQMTLTFSVDASTAVGPNSRMLLIKSSDNSLVDSSDLFDSAVNTTYSYTITWGELCSAMGVAGCSSGSAVSASSTFYFGIDKNNDGAIEDGAKVSLNLRLMSPDTGARASTDCSVTDQPGHGLCYFQVEKGDEKVYISDLAIASDYPTISGISAGQFRAAYFFYAIDPSNNSGNDTTTIQSILNNSSSIRVPLKQASAGSDYELQDNRLNGLSNGSRYCFIAVNEDSAGNLFRATDQAAPFAGTCATPEKVVGLLDDKSCFIATAAFGSDMAPQVELLRQFRDRFLKTNSLGSFFVQKYYQLSPPLAQFISEHDSLKAAVRWALWPFIAFAKISLEIGFVIALASLLLMIWMGREWCRRFLSRKKAKAS